MTDSQRVVQNDSESPGIHLDQVSLTRDGQPVLASLSLSLTERRIGLIGHNGSGKSSLARLLNGLLTPDHGQLSVYGQDPANGTAHMASTVGFIFQNPDHQIIFPTVMEELAFGLTNQGLPRSQAEQQAHDLLAEYGHQVWADRPVQSLSEGQKQLVCIFSVLLMKPRVLVLDEPFSALDLPNRYRLLRLLDSLPQQILMISHELDTLADFERIIWLDQGRVHQDGKPDDVLMAYQAEARSRAQTASVEAVS